MALWVAPNTTPHPAGTPCAPEHKRDIDLSLTIEVESARGSPNSPIFDPTNLVFVAYTGDFRQSVRTHVVTGRKTTRSLDVCINRDDTLVATLWGWLDQGYSSLLGGGDNSYDPWEPVLGGMTKSFAGPNLSIEEEWRNADLRLKLKIEPDLSNDCPNQ
ncbi:hypothetical protein NicSoilB8_34700 [Arthrobacter sp. NicSoilB8]|nr:hypothetical protein NicSoilB8_34700 [Arthrobacter sp. NicSoilB8]